MSVRSGAGGAFLRDRICETYDSVTLAARARSRWSRSSSSSRWRITRATSILNYPPLITWAECAYKLTKIVRSEEHTSELQSQSNLVCRLLLEKKKKK